MTLASLEKDNLNNNGSLADPLASGLAGTKDEEQEFGLPGLLEKYPEGWDFGAPISTTIKPEHMTGLPGDLMQKNVNRAVADAAREASPTRAKWALSRPGMSFDAGQALRTTGAAAKQAVDMAGAGAETAFNDEMYNLMNRLKLEGARADEASKLATWMINNRQTGMSLYQALQSINADMYASQLNTQLALAGIPIDMIGSLLGGLGGSLGNLSTPLSGALSGDIG